MSACDKVIVIDRGNSIDREDSTRLALAVLAENSSGLSTTEFRNGYATLECRATVFFADSGAPDIHVDNKSALLQVQGS